MSDSALEQIGPRLRAARRKQNLTLDELATRAGLSASTLSRLESGKRQANLELLLPLTRELRIGIDELIPSAVPDPRVRQSRMTRHGVEIIRLSPRDSPNHTFRMIFRRRADPSNLRTHEGYDWLYVMSGRLRLLLGDQELTLEPGEAAEFDTQVPHAMGSADGAAVEIISIFGHAGERIHTRAKAG